MATSTYNCFCFMRKFKIGEVQPPDDVRRVFETYADGVGGGGGPTISAEGLRRFLVESQAEKGISSAEVARLMDKLRGGDAGGAKHYLEKIVKPMEGPRRSDREVGGGATERERGGRARRSVRGARRRERGGGRAQRSVRGVRRRERGGTCAGPIQPDRESVREESLLRLRVRD